MSVHSQLGGFSDIQPVPGFPSNKTPRKQQEQIINGKVIKPKSKTSLVKSNVTSKTIKIFSTNAAGLGSGKVNSLRSEVMATTSNIVTIQETHSLRKGLIKMPVGFVTFEAIRKAKHGGTMCTIHEDLNPKLIEEYSDPFEMLVVEVETDINSIRINYNNNVANK